MFQDALRPREATLRPIATHMAPKATERRQCVTIHFSFLAKVVMSKSKGQAADLTSCGRFPPGAGESPDSLFWWENLSSPSFS